MGIFRQRKTADAGHASVYLTSDGRAIVDEQYDLRLGPELISTLAAITAALWIAKTLEVSRHDGNAWLDELSGLADATTLNAEVNPQGIVRFAGVIPPDTIAAASGQFIYLAGRRRGEGSFTGTWQPNNRFSPVADGNRLFGALFGYSQLMGADRAVWHALQMFADANFDFNHPAVLTELPNLLLIYAGQQRSVETTRPPWLNDN